jgi:hypothetical protein
MAKRKQHAPGVQAQGVELIDLVIERARADPSSVSDFCGDYPLKEARPVPAEVLARLTFPSGKPLPPSLKRWLAFDASWLKSLGWFASIEQGSFTPRRIDEIVAAEFDEMWGEMYAPLAERLGECFLLPDGTDSRRIYAVAESDALGEYPVIVIDTDDLPYAAVMYPGFDVYMADHVGMEISDWGTYEDLASDPRYKSRIKQHARHLFAGKVGVEIMDEEWGHGDPGQPGM